jgi:hypothetical protein
MWIKVLLVALSVSTLAVAGCTDCSTQEVAYCEAGGCTIWTVEVCRG